MTTNKSEIETVLCPMCGASACTVWMEDGKRTRYVRCSECQTIYASPRASYSARYAWLDEMFAVNQSAMQNALNRRPALAKEAAILQQYVAGGRLLDIGCDLGDMFEWFCDSSWQRYGVELSPSAATFAAEKYSAQVHAGTILSAAYPSAAFDLVTMIDVFYYLDDPKTDLREVARILKPNGWLAIEMPGQFYQLFRSRGLLCWLLEKRWTRLHTDSAYLFWPNPMALKTILNACGFEVVGWHAIQSPEQPNQFQSWMSNLYFSGISLITRSDFQVLTLTPKYLCVARSIR